MTIRPDSFGALTPTEREPDSDGNVYVIDTSIAYLDGCPEVIVGSFVIDDNHFLTSLVTGPTEVGGHYSAENCILTSLDGSPVKIGGYLSLSSNPLTSLKSINQLKEMKGTIFIDGCPIKSHILGVFFIKGCKGIASYDGDDFGRAAEIVNQNISKGRAGLLPCTKELIEAGLAAFAQI
jgi:hypothetical protein